MLESVGLMIVAGIVGSLLLAVTAAVSADSVPRMSKEEAKALLNSPGAILVDVRQPPHWDAVVSKIPGAVREDPAHVSAWADKYSRDKTLIFY